MWGLSVPSIWMTFPLPFFPQLSYSTGGRRFGAPRDGGKRQHAACDLIASEGTEILAVADGIIVRGPYPFYHGTYALEVEHPALGIVRYGEIKAAAKGLGVGTPVSAGQVIAFVGKMRVDSMLHFEMYDGSGAGPLTVRNNRPFERRSDLIDPTPFLDHSVLASAAKAVSSLGF
jgi:murein DD-endopeptidase MepM/ murein hydrolase activator NlpD